MLQRSHFHFAVNKKMLKKQFFGAKIHIFENHCSHRLRFFCKLIPNLLGHPVYLSIGFHQVWAEGRCDIRQREPIYRRRHPWQQWSLASLRRIPPDFGRNSQAERFWPLQRWPGYSPRPDRNPVCFHPFIQETKEMYKVCVNLWIYVCFVINNDTTKFHSSLFRWLLDNYMHQDNILMEGFMMHLHLL